MLIKLQSLKNFSKCFKDRWEWNRKTKKPKDRYISPKKTQNYWWIKIIIIYEQINKMEHQKNKNIC